LRITVNAQRVVVLRGFKLRGLIRCTNSAFLIAIEIQDTITNLSAPEYRRPTIGLIIVMVEEVLRHPHRLLGIIFQINDIVDKSVAARFHQIGSDRLIYQKRHIIADKPVVFHSEIAAAERRHPDTNMVVDENGLICRP